MLKKPKPPKKPQNIVREFHAHIREQGGPASAWYVGVTHDIDQRLFGEHRVPRENYWFMFRKARTAYDARAVRQAFLDWGCDGETGEVDEAACFVYIYLKSSITNP